jgi:hypothetical protein
MVNDGWGWVGRLVGPVRSGQVSGSNQFLYYVLAQQSKKPITEMAQDYKENRKIQATNANLYTQD